jgi:cephalosporin hydroxylase
MLDALIRSTRERVERRQPAIPTYYERAVLRQATEADPEWLERVKHHQAAEEQGRFVSRAERARTAYAGLDAERSSEIPDGVLIMSQGTRRPLTWRGLDLFKSVFDLAVMQMLLGELRPASIVEVGSGTGASALWMADLAELHGFPCRIVSVDLHPVPHERPGVRFVSGDARRLTSLLPGDALADGPRLVVEDAHTAVTEVLEAVHPALCAGDYLVVEDSVGKRDALDRFCAGHPGAYSVDTDYTDFFGRNATSCVDSILRRLP